MCLQEITLTNFLSYKSQAVQLGPHLNIIVGRNGSGKSNFINSLLFVLAEKFNLRGEERKIVENNIVKDSKEDIGVQITLDNNNKRLPLQTNQVILMRRWTADNKDEYFLNGKQVSLENLTNSLQCFNLNRQNPYNIIRQGKITKISNMKDNELYELLEDISGVKTYEAKKEEAFKILENAQNEKDEIIKMLRELNLQIKQLEDEKESFKSLNEIQQEIQIQEVQLALLSAKNYKIQVVEITSKASKLQYDLKNQHDQKNKLNEDFFRISKQVENEEEIYSKIVDKHQNFQQAVKQLQNQKNKHEKEIQQLEGKKKFLQDHYSQLEVGLENNSQYNNLRNNLKTAVESFQQKQKQCQQLNDQINQIQMLSSSDPIQILQEQLKIVQDQKQLYEQDYKQISLKIKQCEKESNTIKELKKLQEDPQTIQNKIKENEIKLKELSKKNENLQGALSDQSKLKLQLQQKLYKIQTDLDVECKNFDSRQKDSFTRTYFMISQFVQEQGLKEKFFGTMAQIIRIKQEKLLNLIETASGNKLFSLVVQDNQTAKKIIDFNRENNGATLRIFSLDLLRDQQGEKQFPQDVLILKTQIEIIEKNIQPQDAEKLKTKLICNWLCVKNYETALQYADQYEVNCITMENEVVYSEGFLTRLGATKLYQGQNKVLQFQKIYQLREDVMSIESNDREVQRQVDKIQDDILVFQRQQSQYKNEVENLKQQLRYSNSKELKEKEEEIQNLSALQIQLKELIDSSEEKIKLFTQQLKNPTQLKKNASKLDIDKLNKLKQDKNEVSKGMTKSYEELAKLKNELQHFEQMANNQQYKSTEKNAILQKSEQITSQIDNFKQELRYLNKQIEDYEELIKSDEKNLIEQEKSLREKQLQKDRIYQQKESLQNEIDQIQNDMQNLENILKQHQEKIQQAERQQQNISAFDSLQLEQQQERSKAQIIKKIKELKTKFNQKFTDKDKLLFEKLEQIEAKFDQYQAKFDQLRNNEKEFESLCTSMDGKTQYIIQEELFNKFSENFNAYFKQIVPDGQCSVKLIKTAKRNKKNNNFLPGIDIKVAFKAKNTNEFDMLNWYQFSQGEKTVIAFVIIISLQKCEPAPFYILDEFDAALDDNYRSSIAELIQNLSKESQYIIISFRQELMSLRDTSNVLYYKVYHSNQQSCIRQTTQNEARMIILQDKENQEIQQQNKDL